MKKYIVRDGDTMWEISQATGVRLNLLMAANPQVQDPKQLKPGSLIVIPELGKHELSGSGNPTTPPHASLSQPGGMGMTGLAQDSAQMGAPSAPSFGTTVPQTSSKTPKPEYYFGFVWPHVVSPGETWEKISAQYRVPVLELKRMNPELSSLALQPGQLVYVPSPTTPQPPGANVGVPGGGWPAMGVPGGAMGQGYSAYPPGTALPPTPMPTPAPTPAPMPTPAPAPAFATPPITQPNGDGPHTHSPYGARSSVNYPVDHYPTNYPVTHYPYAVHPYPSPHYPQVPYAHSAWYNDWDESSSWDWDGPDGSSSHHDG